VICTATKVLSTSPKFLVVSASDLALDFIREERNFVLVGQNGLGKTMIAKNICHLAVLAGCGAI